MVPPSHGTAVAQPHHRGVSDHPAGTAGGCLAVPGRAQPPEPLSQCSHHLPSWLPVLIFCGSRAWDQSPAEAWILVPSCCCSRLSAGTSCSDWTFPLIFFPFQLCCSPGGMSGYSQPKVAAFHRIRGDRNLCVVHDALPCPCSSCPRALHLSGVLMKSFINSWTQRSESSFPT